MAPHLYVPRSNIVSRVLFILLLALICLFSGFSWAAASLNVTRAIMSEAEKEVTVRIENEGTYPVLIQSWVDSGQENVPLEYIQVPFIIESPQFRLEPKHTQRLRILFTGRSQALPDDRESVFWLNVQEIPPQISDDKGRNYMRIAFRARIKLFYRPKSLVQNIENEHTRLQFFLTEEKGEYSLRIHNPTPFHFTFLSVLIGSDQNKPVATSVLQQDMVSPGGNLQVLLERNTEGPLKAPLPVHYTFINDFGQPVEGTQTLVSH